MSRISFDGLRPPPAPPELRGRVLAACRGARMLAIGVPQPVLTRRQDQIARMAVHYPNAEIAARLDISVRTVENHLQTVYDLLGIHSRAELMTLYDATQAP